MPINPTVGAAMIPVAGDLLKSFTAPGPAGGATDYLRDLQRGHGYGTQEVSPMQIANSYRAGFNALQGQEQRDQGGAETSAAGQAASLGVQNPYAWINHAKAQVGNQYAGQYGNLAAEQARNAVSQLAQNYAARRASRLALIQAGGR